MKKISESLAVSEVVINFASQLYPVYNHTMTSLFINMRTFKTTILLLAICLTAAANDGVYYVNGSQLTPISETDISCAKEVLSIDICDDGFARVDVQYVFMNNGAEKTIDMGFEASAPYNDDSEFNPNGGHPHIFDFTVNLNGKTLSYTNSIVRMDSNFETLDPKKWKVDTEADGFQLVNTSTKESVEYAYAYVFKAHFNPGKNTIHHTYRYRMSHGVGRTFEVPYWLLPAKRWANHQIDDFTLRISTPTWKQFLIEDNVFEGAQFRIVAGKGKIRHAPYKDIESHTEIALKNGTVEWHKTNFDPKDNFTINSSDIYCMFTDNYHLGDYYDRSDTYVPTWNPEDTAQEKRILRNLPYANRGYVFKDKGLREYFSNIWWYMPDPSWKQDTSDFTKKEWELVNQGK